MPDALGVCGSMCKVKKEENLFWGDSQLPSQIARTRVRLLYTFSTLTACKKLYLLNLHNFRPPKHDHKLIISFFELG